MAVPGTHVAAAGAGGLLVLLLAVAGFVVVMVVAVVILALIQAVLPGGDSEADRLHAAELAARADEEPEEVAAGDELRPGPPVG